MIWDYYFIYELSGKNQELVTICKNEKTAKKALLDYVLDIKQNKNFTDIKRFCLVLSYDEQTDDYVINKEKTNDFEKSLPFCVMCRKVTLKLQQNLCTLCYSEYEGIELFSCQMCNGINVKVNHYQDKMYGEVYKNKKRFIVCAGCIQGAFMENR